jgi:hypothetical protein
VIISLNILCDRILSGEVNVPAVADDLADNSKDLLQKEVAPFSPKAAGGLWRLISN